MVVVIVADQHHVDLAQFLNRAGWLPVSLGPEELGRRAAIGKDRVNEQIVLADLDDSSRVTDPSISDLTLVLALQIYLSHWQLLFQLGEVLFSLGLILHVSALEPLVFEESKSGGDAGSDEAVLDLIEMQVKLTLHSN